MGKKSRANKTVAHTARPSGESDGLIRFIRQLMSEKHYAEALRAGQTLVESDPLNPQAHFELGNMLAQLDRPGEAIRQFEMASRLGMERDSNLFIRLAVASSMARFPIHALQAARAGLGLNPPSDQHILFQSIVEGSETYLQQLIGARDIPPAVAERALLLLEESTRALQVNDPERARARITDATRQAPRWPLVWNQLAMLLFGVDELAAAFDACAQALGESGDDDPLILSTLVRLHAVTGNDDDAQTVLERLLALSQKDIAIQEEQAKGLAILARDQEVYDLLAPVNHTENGLHPIGRYLLGVAAANLGRRDEARDAWRNLSREGLVQVRVFNEILGRSEEPATPRARFPYFAATEVVPSTVLEQLFITAQQEPDTPLLQETATRFPYLADAICEMFSTPAIDARLAADMALRLDAVSLADAVRRFATSRMLGDYDRVYAHLSLRAAGLDDPQQSATVWIGGRRRELKLPRLRLEPPMAGVHSQEITDLLLEGATAQEENSSSRAAEIFERILSLDPEVFEAEHNLGTALLLAGDISEGERHLRRALEINPIYILARCNLASLELSRANIPAAHTLLDPLDEQEQFTLEEVIAYLRTRSDLALADGDALHAETLLYTLLAYDHENELARERLRMLAGQPALSAP